MRESNPLSSGYEPGEITVSPTRNVVACKGFEPLFISRITNRPEPIDEHAICFLVESEDSHPLVTCTLLCG